MTERQKNVCYYYLKGYSARQTSLIAGVSDNYARRIINNVEEINLEGYTPSLECVIRRKVLDHILAGASYIFVPNGEKYAYVSLLAYLGYDYHSLRKLFPDDQPQFIYMAIHRSNKAWKDLHSDFMGVTQEDYENLMQIRHKQK